MAVGAPGEANHLAGIAAQDDDSDQAIRSGAAYIFDRINADPFWTQTAYIKASNPEAGDGFGYSVALDGVGQSVAVGSHFEASGAFGLSGDQFDNSVEQAGAAYFFKREQQTWSQQSYIKAIRPEAFEFFGAELDLDSSATILVIGAEGHSYDRLYPRAGAVYLY